VENCQIGTFRSYASSRGHALIDRELYLPESWTGDRARCHAAGIPEDVGFTTKPRQGMAMLARAIEAGAPFSWVTAEEAYSQVKFLRVWLEQQVASYVLATNCNDTLVTTDGTAEGERRADELIAELPPWAWRWMSVGAGAHGPRDTNGHESRSGSAGHPGAGTGYRPDARSPIPDNLPDKSLTTSASAPVDPRCWTWPGSPAPVVASRNASNRPRTGPAWTTTKSAAGGPGTPTSPWRCSLTPGLSQ
jgi:DDE superfamily endonuclease